MYWPRLSLVTALLAGASFALVAQNPAPPLPSAPPPTEQNLPKKDKRRKAADEYFVGPVISLEFKFEAEEWENLKKDNRRYAECTIIETDAAGKQTVYEHAAVKLKGAAGSFRGVDDRPGLTINMDKFKGGDRFHGMDKFHLNNGVQDESLLNEFIAGEWCRAAGVPASRCTHVLLKWNGKDLGLYLFKEGFTKDFLSYFYEKNDGSLYDGHFVTEIDGDLEKQQGDAADTNDLKNLAAAAREGDQKVRWQKLFERLDVDEYLRSLALELFTGHWDGYNFNRNNYRVYFDPKTGKANFFCHGMDQTFADANWPVFRAPESLVGGAVWSNPDWKTHYRKVADAIYQKVIKAHDWEARINEQGKKIQEALARQNPQAAKDYQGKINAARDRVMARVAGIGKQFGEMPQPFDWQNGVTKLGSKHWRAEGAHASLDATVDGVKCFQLRAEPNGAPSLRRSVMLDPGRYRFEGSVKVANVDGEGAGLRISGGSRDHQMMLKGSTQWQKIVYEFDASGSDVTLVAELRAPKGEAWFQAEGFQLVKLK